MATTTPNNGWPVPTSTDYVKDGATAIEALGDAIDTSVGEGLLAWTSYTPVWSGNNVAPTIGNGTATGFFCQIGKTVHYNLEINLGSTSTVGTSTRYTFSLPITAKLNLKYISSGFYFDSSASQYYPVIARNSTTTLDAAFYTMGPSSVTGNVLASAKPVVPANGDIYTISGTYEAA
jgi:hypothetical protein